MPLTHFPRPSIGAASASAAKASMPGYSVRRTCPRGTRIASIKSHQQHKFSTASRTGYPYNSDKDSLDPRPTEYSKSGGDDAAAAHKDAFDPEKTRAEQHGGKSVRFADQKGDDPLDMSPANKESSKQQDPMAGGASNAPGENRARTSGAGSPNKAGVGRK